MHSEMIMKKLLVFFAFSCAAAFAQTSCVNSPITVGPCFTSPTTITVTLVPSVIPVNGQAALQAVLSDAAGTFLGNIQNQCTWSSSDITKATISGNVATGVAGGTPTISCTDGSLLPGTAVLTVQTAPLITQPNSGTCGTPPCALPPGFNGSAYSTQFLATGGTPPYTWTVTVGSIPGWASLSSTGCGSNVNCTLSGTPNANATTNFTITVTDAGSNTNSLAVSLTVTAATACGTDSPLHNYCARSCDPGTGGVGQPACAVSTVSGSTSNGGKPPAALLGLNCATPGACNATDSAIDDMNAGLPGQAHISRVTDYATTSFGAAPHFFTVTSSSTDRQWNSQATTTCSTSNPCIFGTQHSGGYSAFFDIEAVSSPPVVHYIGYASQDVNGIGLGAETQWSATNPLLFYSGGPPSAGFQPATLNRYLLTNPHGWTQGDNNQAANITATVQLNPVTQCPGLSSSGVPLFQGPGYTAGVLGNTWNRYLANSIGDSNEDKLDHVQAMDYRYVQDDGSLIVVYDSTQTAPGCRWLDVRTGQVGGSYGPTGFTTGFGPLPAPAAPTVSMATTGGSLNCATQFSVQITYVLQAVATNGGLLYGGETTPSVATTVGPNGTGTTCKLVVASPVANPGGGSGNNLGLTASGFNSYVCILANCHLTGWGMQGVSGAPNQPSIASVTCTAGAGADNVTAYSMYVVAGNATGNSPISFPTTSSATCSANPATAKPTALFAAVPTTTTYYIMIDSPGMIGITSNGAGVVGKNNSCSTTSSQVTCIFANGTIGSYVNQTAAIGAAANIGSFINNEPNPPTVNSAGVTLHNIRLDESGNWIIGSVADRWDASQGSPANAQNQIVWYVPGTYIIPGNSGAPPTPPTPYIGYAIPHWTENFGGMATWPSPTKKAEAAITPFTNTCGTPPCTALINSNVFFLGSYNACQFCALDTASGDQHFNHSNSINASPDTPVFKDSYSTGTSGITNAYALPPVPYNGEIDAYVFSATANNPNAVNYRFCHNWTSSKESFNATPRGGVSQDGKLFIFSSDMQRNSLGLQGTSAVGLGRNDGTNAGCSTTSNAQGVGCRYDIFMCEIK